MSCCYHVLFIKFMFILIPAANNVYIVTNSTIFKHFINFQLYTKLNLNNT